MENDDFSLNNTQKKPKKQKKDYEGFIFKDTNNLHTHTQNFPHIFLNSHKKIGKLLWYDELFSLNKKSLILNRNVMRKIQKFSQFS